MQLSLLDRLPASAAPASAGAFACDHPFLGVRRVELGDGAWLELARGFLPGHAELLQLVQRSADWEEHRRTMYENVVAVPRLVASCPGTASGRPWNGDSAVRVARHRGSPEDVARAAGLLRQLGHQLSRRYAKTLSSISLALYRDGQDSVAFHGDRLGSLRSDTVVAILSLGSARRFLLRRGAGRPGALPRSLLDAGIGITRARAAERPTFALSVGEGDLLVMGGTCQETWEHGVPKQKQVGPRVAVMFREAWDEGEGGVRNVRGPRGAGGALPARLGASAGG